MRAAAFLLIYLTPLAALAEFKPSIVSEDAPEAVRMYVLEADKHRKQRYDSAVDIANRAEKHRQDFLKANRLTTRELRDQHEKMKKEVAELTAKADTIGSAVGFPLPMPESPRVGSIGYVGSVEVDDVLKGGFIVGYLEVVRSRSVPVGALTRTEYSTQRIRAIVAHSEDGLATGSRFEPSGVLMATGTKKHLGETLLVFQTVNVAGYLK